MERIDVTFHKFLKTELQKIEKHYVQYKADTNKRLQKVYAKDYPHLKRKSKTPFLDEVFEWQSTKDKFADYYNDLVTLYITKITGIYKHGQTDKTWLCNLRIISNVRNNHLTIAISKNTLDSKEQWESRLIQSLKEEHPTTPLKDMILIISSKKNDLNGNATHCKSVRDAIFHYTKKNTFKIIFICSNTTRINNILDFLESYEGMAPEKQIPVEVEHDEAHNQIDGIPVFREIIEQIVCNPHVKTYIPVSASNHSIAKKDSILWKMTNLEAYAIDYTKHSQVVSSSDNYSSIADANKVFFDKLKQHSEYTDYNIEQFDINTFDEADEPGYYTRWDNEDDIKQDKDRRRTLEFCRFMAQEKDACTIAMNVLDNKYIVSYAEDDGTIIETSLILKDKCNIHLIITPCRVVLTLHLIKYAIKQSYNPICIGIYRGGIHLRYKNKFGQIIKKPFGEFSETCTGEQMNQKIDTILNYVKSQGESLERPIIIMGNLKVTGESITFVNYTYGILRTTTVLPSIGQTREDNYQALLRSCYTDTIFRRHIPDFKHPPKWILGTRECIHNACTYELENDARIARLLNGSSIGLIPQPDLTRTVASDDDMAGISVPCKITVLDPEDKLWEDIRKLVEKSMRSLEDKKHVFDLIQTLIQSSAAKIDDPTNKLISNWKKYTLTNIRSWKTHSEDKIEKRKEKQKDKYKPFEADYRFCEYDSAHRTSNPYINNKAEMNIFNCELLVAFDKYTYEGFVNHKTVVWLSYKYE